MAVAQAHTKKAEHMGAAEPKSLEDGRIFFLFRPKVGTQELSSINDVQRFMLVLEPTSRPDGPARLMVIGKKRMPAIARHERFFGFVEAVGDSVSELTADLGPKSYETKTRGTRTQPAAEAAGSGVYAIVQHGSGSKSSTRLDYQLEVPDELGPVQQAFELHKSGSYVLSIKNPSNKPTGVPSAGPEPQYSEEQQEEFKDYRWIDAQDVTLLDVVGTEFLLVASREGDLQEGETVLAHALVKDEERARAATDAPAGDTQAALQDFMDKTLQPDEEHPIIPTEPAKTGDWQTS